MRTAAPPLALLAALAAACAHVEQGPERPMVIDLRLEGVRSVSRSDLEDKLATQAATLRGLLIWQDQPRLDEGALAVDRLRVEAYYRAHGYYDAKVVSSDVRLDDEGRAIVTIRVEEGRPVRVTAVEVTGLESAPEAAARLRELAIRVGEVFTERDYDATRAAIERALLETGYPTGEVTQSAQVDPEAHTATARYAVQPGPRYRFGQIFVSGTTAVPRELIREQAALEIKPGDPWNETKLALAHARVFGLGVFAGVRVTRGTPDPEKGIIPVVVTVREAPFRTIRAGPGIGVEATRMDVHGTAGWTNRNLFGDLQRLTLDALVGYAWLPTFWGPQKQGPVGNVTAEFYQPSAIAQRVDVSTRVQVERGMEPAYDFWSVRFRFGLPIRIAPRWSFVPSYNAELYGVNGDLVAGTEETELACNGNICFVSYVEERLSWDGLDRPIDTRSGWAVSLSVQEGFDIGAYGYQYVRVLPKVEWYTPLGRSFVLAARLRVGALVPLREGLPPPITARFFAGGPGSMRGFNTTRLSPYAQETDGSYAPVGGNGLVDGSLELRAGVGATLSGALFVDMGNVSDFSPAGNAWTGALDPAKLQWATGIGLRYKTPVGPIRLDVAVRLPTQGGPGLSWREGLPPLPGLPPGENEPVWAFNLSIGDSF
jgi:translocation and assembly module TamA